MAERPQIFSVTELTRSIRELIEGVIGEVWVEGEICNYRKQASGHQYFTLKDDRSQLACVHFYRPGFRSASNIPLRDGMQVQARGTMTVYEARGQYQLNVSLIQPAGEGLLAARFEALKRKLAAEGLFDAERKKPIPRFPKAIGVVTSPTGAVIRDMINVLHRRAPWISIIINPVRVQGAGAAAEIAAAVEEFNSGALPPVDVIVVARGGGSAEDLWEFNEEVLARAIASSELPVVSAVGHEIDFSIADFVADLRAPTPSAAAELLAPDTTELLRRLQQMGAALRRAVQERIDRHRRDLAFISRSVLFREPRMRLDRAAQDLDALSEALQRAVADRIAFLKQRVAAAGGTLREHRPDQMLAMRRHQVEAVAGRLRILATQQMEKAKRRLEHSAALLRILGPQATLDRGYSITRNASGEIIRSAAQVKPGDTLITRVADGDLESKAI